MNKVMLIASDKGELKGFSNDYIKVVSGVGPMMAAATAAYALEHYKPDVVVNIGSAGAVSDNLIVGKAYSFSSVVTPDQNLSAFHVKLGSTLDDRRTTIGKIDTIDRESNLILGSSGTFYKELQPWHSSLCVDCQDMEGYGVAVAALKVNVPFLCIKLITDKLGDSSSIGKIDFNLRKGREELIATLEMKLR